MILAKSEEKHLDERIVDRVLNEINNLPVQEIRELKRKFEDEILPSLEIYFHPFPDIKLDNEGRILNYNELLACYYVYFKGRRLEDYEVV